MANIHIELNGGQFDLTYDENDKKSRTKIYKMLSELFEKLWLYGD